MSIGTDDSLLDFKHQRKLEWFEFHQVAAITVLRRMLLGRKRTDSDRFCPIFRQNIRIRWIKQKKLIALAY